AADQTISIDSVVFSDNFRHSKFVTYRAKDAIVDYFQEKAGKRPSVRITNADLALNLHISGHTCTLSLDSSGESLHKRGYRVDQTESPLNEVFAAGMILKSGWKGEKNFLDPMCGSGTLLIEAAMIATNTPPGVYRQGFAFEKWKDYDSELFDRLYNDESGEREFDFRIYGSDISPKAIEIARENIKSAGLSRCVNLRVMPFQQYTEETAPKDATMIMNPPYGERISSRDILSLYEMIGSTLKHQFKGYDAWILSYREECFEKIGLKPSVKFDLMNGGLDCEFRKYEIFAGKLKEFKSEGGEFSKDEKFLEIPEGTNYKKRELRKERFTDFKAGNSRGRRDDKPAGKGRPVGRRESTFKKFGDAPTERRPRTEGFERRPRPEGAERRPRTEGFERRPRPEGAERRPRTEGFERRPRTEGFERRPRPEGAERRPRTEGFDRSQSKYDQSGNFRRNSEGKLELRTDGEFKPRGERTFNPNRPMYIPGRDEKGSENTNRED
ncbi:MAG: hypothetical protein RR837_03770, partial [Bacteroidales bacterium]